MGIDDDSSDEAEEGDVSEERTLVNDASSNMQDDFGPGEETPAVSALVSTKKAARSGQSVSALQKARIECMNKNMSIGEPTRVPRLVSRKHIAAMGSRPGDTE